MTNFDGINAKITRAGDQISLLKAEMDKFSADIRQSIHHEVHEDSGEQVWVFRGATPYAPVEWSIRIGEILYNLRSALDHLVWQMVLANGQIPGRHNQFPIVKNESGWQQVTTKRNVLEGVSPSVKSTVKRLQPYTGGVNLTFDVSAFGTLHSLCNIDKHRHLNLTAIASYGPKRISFEERDGSPKREAEIRSPDKTADLLPVSHIGMSLPSQFTGLEDPEDIRLRPWAIAPIGKIEKDKVLFHLNNAAEEINPFFQLNLCFEDVRETGVPADKVPDILDECLVAVRGAFELLTEGHCRT